MSCSCLVACSTSQWWSFSATHLQWNDWNSPPICTRLMDTANQDCISLFSVPLARQRWQDEGDRGAYSLLTSSLLWNLMRCQPGPDDNHSWHSTHLNFKWKEGTGLAPGRGGVYFGGDYGSVDSFDEDRCLLEENTATTKHLTYKNKKNTKTNRECLLVVTPLTSPFTLLMTGLVVIRWPRPTWDPVGSTWLVDGFTLQLPDENNKWAHSETKHFTWKKKKKTIER